MPGGGTCMLVSEVFSVIGFWNQSDLFGCFDENSFCMGNDFAWEVVYASDSDQ